MQQSKKVLLVLIDGLRPDAIGQCRHSFLRDFMETKCAYTDVGQSVMPTITLPCHLSLFLGVSPERHGTFNNTYVPPVHKVDGLFEVLAAKGKKCYSFYTWEELRDLSRPGSLARQELCNYYEYGVNADNAMCDRAILALKDSEQQPDFMFCYSGNTDEVAHKYGWMSEAYMEAVEIASRNIEKLYHALPDGYCMIVTADHGGHDRLHGTDMPEDMNIPIMIYNGPFPTGKVFGKASLLDLAPTIASLCGVQPSRLWDGESLEFRRDALCR